MKDSVVIVTGGGRGIGRAICIRFAEAGAQVVAVARTSDDLVETRRRIETIGGRCHIRSADVTAPAEFSAVVESTLSRFGRIDVLVNNAGIAPLAPFDEVGEAVFDAVYAVNIKAAYMCCHAVWPTMKAAGSGVIVNISSMASVDPFPGFATYGASKAWINTWTKALAAEGRAFGIGVFAVAPGAVETDMLRGAFPDFPPDQALHPRDVAEQVFALAEPSCRHATGQTVFIKK